jgi:hypothetical protein
VVTWPFDLPADFQDARRRRTGSRSSLMAFIRR